jgi:hypothetical protein
LVIKYAIMGRLSVAVAVLLTASTVAAQPESRFVLVAGADRAGNPLLGLRAQDFTVENGGVPCDVIAVSPATYPVAIIVDTSNFARSDFQLLRSAVQRFVSGAARDIAVYTSGAPMARVQGFTRDQGMRERTIEHLFATPDGTTQTLTAVLRVGGDLRPLNEPVAAIVVVSAGGIEANAPAGREVVQAVLASHAILHVIDRRTIQIDEPARASYDRTHGTRILPDSSRRGDVLEALARRTSGEYVPGVDATAYAFGLEAVRRQLDAEVIVEYAVPPNAPRDLRLGIRVPGSTLGRAIGLERAR